MVRLQMEYDSLLYYVCLNRIGYSKANPMVKPWNIAAQSSVIMHLHNDWKEQIQLKVKFTIQAKQEILDVGSEIL